MYFKARNFSETNFCELKETQNIKELTSAYCLSSVFLAIKSFRKWANISNIKECSRIQLFELKVCLTFDDLNFVDITPFAVSSGCRKID